MTAPTAPFPQMALNPERLARRALSNARLTEEIICGLNASEARVKYGCMKALRVISVDSPELLYPHFEFFTSLLNHENKILHWEALAILSRLTSVDTEDKFDGIFKRYFAPISGPVMITAANVIRSSPHIARAKPQLAERIVAEMLKVPRARYQTAECRNVVLGHTILALGEMFELLRNPAPVFRFVRNQLKNPRQATRKKATEFLKRFQPGAKRARD